MANTFFLRKIAVDQLIDTLFFATGETVLKEKNDKFIQISVSKFSIKVFSLKNITLNRKQYTSVNDVKFDIQNIVI